MSLSQAINKRRSVRQYTGDSMPLEYLSTIVHAAIGYTGQAEVRLTTGEEVVLKFRATPSGGGLQPVAVHVAALNVKKLARGLYRYDPHNHLLVRLDESAAIDRLIASIALPEEVISVSRANALLLLIGQPWRSMRKYGARGMRLVFMEAGYIAQNIHLATTGLGYGSVDCSAIYDDEAHNALNIDGQYETLIHTVALGCPG